LDDEKALKLLDSDGPLASKLKNYEERREQKEMMRHVLDAYRDGQVALIEAGTGTGKSLAYLIPAMLFALRHKERTLISTHTIALQEQLFHKDIPFLAKALGIDLKTVLVKGMGNYLCLRKLQDAMQELLLVPEEERKELEQIDAWSGKTSDGSRSELPFHPSSEVWEKVAAESDACNRDSCPFYRQCHFFKARKRAQEAQLIISNHSLLFSDLAYRAQGGQGLLPDYNRIVLDEAHNIEEIATDHFAVRASEALLMKTLGRLATQKSGKNFGKLPLLRQKLLKKPGKEAFSAPDPLIDRLENSIAGQVREVRQKGYEAFEAFASFIEAVNPSPEGSEEGEGKLRILETHQKHPLWNELLLPKGGAFIEAAKKLTVSLQNLVSDLNSQEEEELRLEVAGLATDIGALAERLEMIAQNMESFTAARCPPEQVRWIESIKKRGWSNVHLIDASLDISKLLAKNLFLAHPTAILCSATLTTGKKFSFIRKRLGLVPELIEEKEVTENLYCSPFNYQEQALLAIPNDMPYPAHPDFTKEAAERILDAVRISYGNAFILFTSYSMMLKCHALLKNRLKEERFSCFVQGEMGRRQLLKQFQNSRRSLLFGTASFWEGIDVVGEALRLVILVKLPFRVPTEPIVEARCEALRKEGGEPFFEYQLPAAIVKFKQGFGRLIRKKRDRGCILCLDPRLITKPYGKQFLASLPPCGRVLGSREELKKTMKAFYRRTYHLTKTS